MVSGIWTCQVCKEADSRHHLALRHLGLTNCSSTAAAVQPLHPSHQHWSLPVGACLVGEGQQAGLAQVVLDVPHMEAALGVVHLLEQFAGWLAQQRAQHIQAPPVRHPQHYLQA